MLKIAGWTLKGKENVWVFSLTWFGIEQYKQNIVITTLFYVIPIYCQILFIYKFTFSFFFFFGGGLDDLEILHNETLFTLCMTHN